MNLTDLTEYTNHIDLLTLTVEQIKKDFDLYGMEIHFSGNENSAYEELTSQISPYIENLLNSNYEKFLSLLYRIDVPEKKLSQIIMHSNDVKVLEISDLIIKRELQKVVIRTYYKENENRNHQDELE